MRSKLAQTVQGSVDSPKWSKNLSFNIALKNLWATFLRTPCICLQTNMSKCLIQSAQKCDSNLYHCPCISCHHCLNCSFFSSHLYVWKPTVRRTRVMWGGAIENHETNLSWSTVTRQPSSAYIFKNFWTHTLFCCLHNKFWQEILHR